MVRSSDQCDAKALPDCLRAEIAGTLARFIWFQGRGDHGDASIEFSILENLKARLAMAEASI